MEQPGSGQHAAEAQQADGAPVKPGDLLEQSAPLFGRDKGEYPLQHQQQTESDQQFMPSDAGHPAAQP